MPATLDRPTTDAATPHHSLSPLASQFILHWGEMGSRWGINRTVAQVHALLYLSADPLPADTIAETLGVARSNVSTSIRELQGWGIVHTVPVLGQRKDHFATETDVWEMFQQILDERKKREVDPTLAMLRACIAEAKAEQNPSSRQSLELERLESLADLIGNLTGWYDQVRRLPTGTLRRFLKLGAGVVQKVAGLNPGRSGSRGKRPGGSK